MPETMLLGTQRLTREQIKAESKQIIGVHIDNMAEKESFEDLLWEIANHNAQINIHKEWLTKIFPYNKFNEIKNSVKLISDLESCIRIRKVFTVRGFRQCLSN